VLNFNLRFYPKRYKNSLCQKLLIKYKIYRQNEKDKGYQKCLQTVKNAKHDELLC